MGLRKTQDPSKFEVPDKNHRLDKRADDVELQDTTMKKSFGSNNGGGGSMTAGSTAYNGNGASMNAASGSSSSSSFSSIPPTLLLATLYASISGLLFGYQMGITGGALHSLVSSMGLTSAQAESVSSFFFIGLMVASPFGGYACDRLGRRSSVLYTDGVFFLASLVLFFAQNYNSILAGRFIAGCASGVSLIAAVSYISELASAEHHHAHRGALVSTVEASVSLGFLISYLAAYGMTVYLDFEEGWRILFGAGTFFLAAVQWIGMRKMPESPEWLAEKGFHDKAHAALRRITPRNLQDGEDSSLAGRLAEAEAEVRGRSSEQVPLEYGEVNFFLIDDCPQIQHYWRQAVIVAFLAIAEQTCGHINIINYAPVIFAEVFFNYSEEEAAKNGEAIATELLNTTIILGVVKFVITTFVLFEVDKLGRRFLLKAGAGTVTVSLFFLALAFSVNLEDVESISASGEIEYVHSDYQHVLALIGCTGVVSGFALSYGPITWLVVAELSPSSIRGRMLGFYTVLTHGCAAIISYTFLSGQSMHGEAFPFWLYFSLSLVSFVFIIIAVPDTGGVVGSDVDDVESILDNTW
eukprot:CAMPEP_0201723570 /NCGR_PEP_ID=MMETSP0593-20130828/7584_1 /ASSEMBLY_ACC=CAM_ASM_000672 /TAXON_ID=267983 /ORGANISM="Skeletonema japonicum, Strain CCMP2506" /LENGTH=580 /DNA_ID=CAMNT_0048214699 /DNA_START=131 /DNA_END=1870 /DNA_ORIENTATION=-